MKSVQKGLPTIGTRVLVNRVEKYYNTTRVTVLEAIFSSEGKFVFHPSGEYTDITDEITHWMWMPNTIV